MPESIKMTNAALDELGAEIVIRGVVDPASLAKLLVAPYQREILSISSVRELACAIKAGGVPDITLGMRGGSFLERDGAFYLQDPVYIIDGLQRRTAALEILHSGELPHLGATIYCNTSEVRERVLFKALNNLRTRLSPNVTLRNERWDNDFVEMLWELCKDSGFSLHHRVCWQQRMKREELITAVGLLKAASRLHYRLKTGLLDYSFLGLSDNMKKLMDRIGRTQVRANIRLYWQILDDCYDVKNVTFKEGAAYLRQTFNMVLSRVFADHQEFWKDTEFKIPLDLKKKLALFPLSDPHIVGLCSAGGASMDILYNMIIQHINSGKRTRRLTSFVQDIGQINEQEGEDCE